MMPSDASLHLLALLQGSSLPGVPCTHLHAFVLVSPAETHRKARHKN